MPRNTEEDKEYCPNCGQHSGGESICPNCGAILNNADDELDGFHEDDGNFDDEEDL